MPVLIQHTQDTTYYTQYKTFQFYAVIDEDEDEDATEVHFGLRLLDRTADPAYCHNYPDVNEAREQRHLERWSSNWRNTFKDAT